MVETRPRKQGPEFDIEEKVPCFFDPNHMVPKSRLMWHYTTKCQAYKYMKNQVKRCPYNVLHFTHTAVEMELHKRTCPDRPRDRSNYADTFQNNTTNGSTNGTTNGNNSDWGDWAGGTPSTNSNGRGRGGGGVGVRGRGGYRGGRGDGGGPPVRRGGWDDSSDDEEATTRGPPSMYGAARSESGYGDGGAGDDEGYPESEAAQTEFRTAQQEFRGSDGNSYTNDNSSQYSIVEEIAELHEKEKELRQNIQKVEAMETDAELGDVLTEEEQRMVDSRGELQEELDEITRRIQMLQLGQRQQRAG